MPPGATAPRRAAPSARLASQLKAPRGGGVRPADGLLEDRRRLEREVSDLRKKLAMGSEGGSGRGARVAEIAGVSLMARSSKASRCAT